MWRVGHRPDPWAWALWKYAVRGRFGGRWDDPDGTFRTVYAGESLLACLLEVLACFRPDTALSAELDAIEDNGSAKDPTPPPPGGGASKLGTASMCGNGSDDGPVLRRIPLEEHLGTTSFVSRRRTRIGTGRFRRCSAARFPSARVDPASRRTAVADHRSRWRQVLLPPRRRPHAVGCFRAPCRWRDCSVSDQTLNG